MFWDSDGLRETPAYVPEPYVPASERAQADRERELAANAERARLTAHNPPMPKRWTFEAALPDGLSDYYWTFRAEPTESGWAVSVLSRPGDPYSGDYVGVVRGADRPTVDTMSDLYRAWLAHAE